MEISLVSLDELVEDPQNPRQHSERNLATIRASLTEFGQVEPLLVQRSTNMVIGGNGRLAVMRDLGWDEAAVNFLDLEDAAARKLSVVLNRSGELATWNYENLGPLLKGLNEEAATEVGFTVFELGKIMESIKSEAVDLDAIDGASKADRAGDAGEDAGGAKQACPKCGFRWSQR